MKIRTDFVTNSSSSSFVLEIRIELKNGEVLKFTGEGTTGEWDAPYYGITARKSPEELGKSENIDVLIRALKNSVVEEGDGNRPVFGENSELIHDLRKLRTMDEIKTIEITGEREREHRDEYMHERKGAIYHLDSGKTDYIYSGKDYDDEGSGGRIAFSVPYPNEYKDDYEKYLDEFEDDWEYEDEKEDESPEEDFVIENGELKMYEGDDEYVVIPRGITSIGEEAFEDFEDIISIRIPKGVIAIGQYAFAGCDGLERIVIPNSVISIGENAFKGCYALRRVIAPNRLKLLIQDMDLFEDCDDELKIKYVDDEE